MKIYCRLLVYAVIMVSTPFIMMYIHSCGTTSRSSNEITQVQYNGIWTMVKRKTQTITNSPSIYE